MIGIIVLTRARGFLRGLEDELLDEHKRLTPGEKRAIRAMRDKAEKFARYVEVARGDDMRTDG